MKKFREFKVYYNDGVFAQSMYFDTSIYTSDDIELYILDVIKEFNENINKDYHITRKNIIEIK